MRLASLASLILVHGKHHDLAGHPRAERFHRRHEELYTYNQPSHDVVLVNARIAVVGELPALPEEAELASRAASGPRTERTIYLDGRVTVPIYDLDALAPGQVIEGPVVVEAPTTTALLWPGDRAVVTRHGWLDIRITS